MSEDFRVRVSMDLRGNYFHLEGGKWEIPSIRNALTVVIGEFCGTFMFLLLSFIGAQTALDTNAPGSPDAPVLPYTLLYIAAAFGTALAVNVWIFYRVTGGMFNPAVTLGLVLVGAVKPLRGLMIVPTQFAAGIAAGAVTDGLLSGRLTVTKALSPTTSVAQGLFLEMFLTSQLVLNVYFLAVEKHRATFLAPIGIGVSVFIAHMAGTRYTGTSINPARSFGPAVIAGFVPYHWIYWLGPCMGTFIAFFVYSLLKALDYSTANPSQDSDDLERVLGPSSAYASHHNNNMAPHGHEQHGQHDQQLQQNTPQRTGVMGHEHYPSICSPSTPRTRKDSVLEGSTLSPKGTF